jgi:hypothetical protein
MGRLEKYREMRHLKHKYYYSVLLFAVLLVSGLFITDYATNKLMSDVGRLQIVYIKSADSRLEINLMNYKFYINTSYVNRDLRKLKNILSTLRGSS